MGWVFIKALLAIEDGTVLSGRGFGCQGEVVGEVVFNTGMVGYTEALTDPSYSGQILLQTYPLVGSYGVPSRGIVDSNGLPLHYESDRIHASGYAVAELQERPSHWSSTRTLNSWLSAEGVPGISGIDTRELTKKLRIRGTMWGVLAVGDDVDPEAAVAKAGRTGGPDSKDLVRGVTVPEPMKYGGVNRSVVVVVIDCGMKYGILRALLSGGVGVVRVPYDSSPEEIRDFRPAGVLISNGPGDPKRCTATINTVKELLYDGDMPLMGICLGNQILALAAGGDTYKLPFGHRGQNQPCIDLNNRRCYITSQNHGYAVRPESLEGTGFHVSFLNANDRTVEGISHVSKPAFGVQFHPEASPGPMETGYLFEEFLRGVKLR